MTDEQTTAGFRCAECGNHTMVLVNARCFDCARKATPARGSWTCARCGASNAPHVDTCSCRPGPAGNFSGFKVVPDLGLSNKTASIGGPGGCSIDLSNES